MGQGQVGRLRADGVREITLGELLPESFGPEYLELPRMVGKDVAGVVGSVVYSLVFSSI